MTFQWLKRWMPRSLYGRAVLILLLPVVTVQLVVSVAFIQRHYEGVTRQMAGGMALQLAYLRDGVVAAPADQAVAVMTGIATPLGMRASLPAPPLPSDDGRVFYDFAAAPLIATLAVGLPDLRAVRFDGMRSVTVWLPSPHGSFAVTFARSRVTASNPHQLLVLMVVLGALMTWIAYAFLRNQLRPITRLAAAAAEYGKGRVVPYTPGGAAEVRAAGTAFLEMRGRIERQGQARTLMLSGVSHDLRTPLTRLRLGLGLMDDAEAASLIRDVEEMGQMVDSFLDFARADLASPTEPTDALALVRQVVADAKRAGQMAQLGAVEGVVAPLGLRPQAIRRAVENLIGNALHHGSRAEVSLVYGERTLRITVEDDGPGIPPDQRDDALRPFVRLDAARNQDRGSGVGLGLAIVADVARAHGGVLRLGHSDRLGGLRADLVLAR